MKKLYILSVLLFFYITVNSQTTVFWNTPVTVSTGFSNIYPRLTLMNNDLPFVIWSNSTTKKIYSSKWSGTSFSAPLIVHNSGVIPYIATWTGAEVASLGDTVFVALSTDLSAAKVYTVKSSDGGNSFADTVRVDENTENIPRLPAIGVNSAGNPVIAYMIHDTAAMDTEYATAHSTDGGLSYSTLIPDPNPPGFACDCCPPSMVVNGNREALVFRNNISNLRNMWASFSSDGGITFPASAEIDQTNWMLTSCPSSGPSGIITGDSLITTWMSEGTSGDPRIYIGTVNVTDQQFGFNKQIYPFGAGTQNFPVIAGNGDTLGVVWQGFNGGVQEILFTHSVSGAAGLGIKVDTITKGTTGHQTRPHLTYKNGSFHVVFRDTNGASVKYMKGNVSLATGISEIKPDFSASSFYRNNSIDLVIVSEENCKGTYKISNAAGQNIAASDIQINKGKNELSISGNYANGVYFINVITSEGKMSKNKLLIIN
jgi:hypothetical protein